MKRLLIFLLATFALGLYAQPVPGMHATTTARTGGAVAFGEDGATPWYAVNPLALDDTRDFSWKTLGFGKPVVLYPAVSFESELNWRGKKLASETFITKLGSETYLFGGQAYLDVNGILPVESRYAKALDIYMGWCYQITPYLDIDIGGNIFFYDKPTYGVGQTGIGSKDTSDLHIGFALNVPLHPWVWATYDFVHDQVLVEGGFIHTEELAPWGLENFALQAGVTGGWTHANRYAARAQIAGEYPENTYAYLYAKADLIYRPMENLAVSAGVRWSLNNDGTGYDPNGLWRGPDNSVWFGVRVVYALTLGAQ